MTTLDKVKRRIVEAVPGINNQPCTCKLLADETGCLLGGGHTRPIRLADILLAIEKKYKGDLFATVASNGWFHFGADRVFYNLSQDDLTLQSPECIELLAKVLNV